MTKQPNTDMTSDSVEVNNQLTVVKSINVRQRRFKIRRLKYTCQTKSSQSSSPDNKKELPVNGEARPNNCSAEISLSLDDVLSSFEDEKLVSLSYGTAALKGRSKEMEDAARVELGFVKRGTEKYDFFGVYDGHGGWRVAERCKERLHEVVAETVATGMEWEGVMERSFERMDEEVVMDRMMGSTAVIAVVGKEEVVVANCGDSRAVICRKGVAVPLSVDHKADRPDELERIEGAGGRVINWNGQRVLGVLATSRSIGDECLKPFIISKPEVKVIKRTGNEEFLILASDGLWDVISNELACQVGRKCLSGRMRRRSQEGVRVASRAAEAAAVLADLALARGSHDNITVIVIELNNNK